MLNHVMHQIASYRPRRPSAALMVALIALVASVTGNAAAAVMIGSNSQVAQNTISGHHPPSGKHANIIAKSITDGDLAALPAWHGVHPHGGAAPAFACFSENATVCWQNSNTFADLPSVGFYQWHGEVHLKGNACVSGCGETEDTHDETIFTLPQGFRPAHTVIFRVASNAQGTFNGTVLVQASTGNVIARVFDWEGVDLNGISFRIDN